jgi:predicted small lipoprotein YifL
MSRARPTARVPLAAWIAAAALLAGFAAIGGCGQSGPLALPGSGPAAPPAQTAPADSEDTDPQEEEQEAE